MAIGRIAGPLLYPDLDREGVDLQFTTNGQPLLYLDFANFRAAINANADNTTDTFTVNGSAKLSNLTISNDVISSTTGNIYLGNAYGLKIDGGSPDYILSTDGSGNLSWQHISAVSGNLSLTGSSIILGNPIDLSLKALSAYRYWTSNTTVTDRKSTRLNSSH